MPRFTGYVSWFFWTGFFSEKMNRGRSHSGGNCRLISQRVVVGVFLSILLLLDPAAISLPVHTSGEFSELIYFSFVRLTPLGYGEITPVSWMAQNLTLLEAVWGQPYLVVRVARLVGLHLSGAGQSDHK